MITNEETPNRKKKWVSLSFFELMTTLISFAGFLLVINGLNSNEQAVSTDTYLKTYGWTLEIDKMLIDNPTLRPYFFNDKPISVPPRFADTGKIAAVADYMLDIYDAVLNNHSYFKNDKATEKQWQKTISGYFRQSPVLCERFLHTLGLYGADLEDAYKNK